MDAGKLDEAPLFASLPQDAKRELAEFVNDTQVASGKHLVDQGDQSYNLFVILEGKAEVDAVQGKRTLGPGDFFGEIALIDNGPRTATVKAATPMRCLVLGHSQFRDVLHQNGEIAVKILRAVTERLRAATPLPTG